MKKVLLLLTAGLMAQGLWAADQELPESGKFYAIQHSSGYYLTRDNGRFIIAEPEEGMKGQAFLFTEVNEETATYSIAVDDITFFASDSKWSATVLSNNAASYAQFDVAISEDAQYVLLRNRGQYSMRGSSKSYLGTDQNTAGAEVYTDKDGKDGKHQWTLVEVADYAFPESIVGEDVYPEYDLPDSDPRKSAYPGYKLVFAEEFNHADGQPSTEFWSYESGWKRNNEDQYYCRFENNVWFENGVCVINGRREPEGQTKNPSYDPRHGTGKQLIEFLTWTSASMMTRGQWDGGYSWQYGIYEVRAKIPAYTGCWPAIWSTGKQYSWPKCGEIDLMEWYGGRIHGNVCWGNTQWNSATVAYNTLNAQDPDTEWGDEYHVWRMFWDYDHIEMWCDNVLVNNIDLSTTFNPISEGQQWSGVNPFRDVRQVVWVNLAMGGNSGGSLANCPDNNYYMIDYVRVYQRYGTDGKATYHVDEYGPDATIKVPDKDAILDGISSATADDDAQQPVEYYNLQGMRLSHPQAGEVVIRRQGSKATKMIMGE